MNTTRTPRTIARTHTRQVARLRIESAGWVAIEHGTDMGDNPTRDLVPAAAAWAWYDRWEDCRIYEMPDGSYRIGGGAYHARYEIAPEDHPIIRQIREAAARAEQAEADRRALLATLLPQGIVEGVAYLRAEDLPHGGVVWRAYNEELRPLFLSAHNRDALRVQVESWRDRWGRRLTPRDYPTPERPSLPPLPDLIRQTDHPGLIDAVSIRVEWSESAAFMDGQEFTGPGCWAAFDACKRRAVEMRRAAGLSSGGYDKTKFVVTFADGHTYGGRYDIACNGHDGTTLEQHILSHATFYTGMRCPAHMTAEHYAEVVAQDGRADEWRDFLTRYRIGRRVKPRARVWSDGTPYDDGAPPVEMTMTAAELLDAQNAAREMYAGLVPDEVVERALQALAERHVTVTDHDQGAVWLDSETTPAARGPLN